jgi:macrolide transport system ATP-binding/permease protein
MLRQRPAFTLAAVLSLALGIGANATVYTWIRGLLLHPLPGVPEQARIVYLENRNHAGNALGVSYPDFEDYRAGAKSVSLVAQDDVAMSVTVGRQAERVHGALVSGDFFQVLDVKLARGRAFLPDEDRVPDARPVVVLSHALWQRRLGGDPEIVGRTIILNGRAFTVVGVADQEFAGTWGGVVTELWVPMMMQPSIGGGALDRRGSHWATVLGRLRPGASRESARAELDLVARRLAEAYPNTNRGTTVRLYPVWQAPGGAGKVLGPVLAVLAVVVALVLLIACANVANLLLGRALERRREMAIRLALGASRGRIVRQLLVEGLFLAAAGCACGLVVARWSAGLLTSFLPPMDAPVRLPSDVDAPVVAFTALVACLAAAAFSLAPALQGSRADVALALKAESGAAGGSRRKAALRNLLVVGQVAISVVLLVAAGLFLRSLQNARHADPGFDTAHVLLAGLDLFPNGYSDDTGVQFYERMLDRVRALPGVRAASVARRVPINFGGRSQYVIEGEGYQAAPTEEMAVEYNSVSPGYFQTLGIPLTRGRDFEPSDRGDGARHVIVNDTMAKRFWPGEDPIGKRLRINSRWVPVVGVARDITYHQLGEAPQSYMYVPLFAAYRPETSLQVRTEGDPAASAGAVRDVVRGLDPNLPLFDVTPMSAHMGIGLVVPRIAGTLLGLFSGLAVSLATVGLFGVISYLVGQRWHEMGVRMALGARPLDVLALVVGHGLRLAGIGLALGAAAAAGLTRLVARQLHDVSPLDPATFAAVAAFMLAVALAASYGPARRASRLDPLATLRHE